MTDTLTTPMLAEVAPPSSAGVRLRGITKSLGGREIIHGLDLDVARGELVSLLGPSGCGKTTTLRMIAGFLTPDAGEILIADADLTRVPPERRPTAMVFQNYALWPHMTVAKNVAFPLKVHKVPTAERQERVAKALALVDLASKAERRPARLSGGEQQRVALARALVQEPQLLLLDEPLSNLDAKLRVQVREDIRRIQRDLGITTVVVTHDQEEALAISDRIAVMNSGRIEQISDPITLYRRPRTRFVAGFIGQMSFVPARPSADAEGAWIELGDGTRLPCQHVTATTHQDVVVGIRPEEVLIDRRPRSDSPTGVVRRLTPKGHVAEADIEVGHEQVRALVPVTDVAVGDSVSVRAGEALVFRDGQLLDERPVDQDRP